MALQELIYTSLANPASSHAAVQDILKSSQRNNVAHEITGLLLFDGDRYIQILEGVPQNLDLLFSKISSDSRHHSLELLHRGPVASRAFSDWRMAYEEMPKGLLDDLAENMAVYAMENEGEILDPEDSFGARLNGMFMDAIAAE
ncbi:BLUF domain-containing protein [Litorimonas sp. WD9-15]|uniref:BLUF domain-containing protein n=1 Tax=Litorimonas sp. WD9-15 TaxID=3418716 RepID=UPI003D06F87A